MTPDIAAALSIRLNALGLPMDAENSGFVPQTDVLYVREQFVTPTASGIGLSFTSSVNHSGVYRVLVMAPRQSGKGPANAAANQVLNHFARGTELTRNGQRVLVSDVAMISGFADGDRWVVPVEVTYKAFKK